MLFWGCLGANPIKVGNSLMQFVERKGHPGLEGMGGNKGNCPRRGCLYAF